MDTIIFESLGGDPTETPGAEALVDVGFRAFGLADELTGGIGYTRFGFRTFYGDGFVPDPPTVAGTALVDVEFTMAYSFGPIALQPGAGLTDVGFVARGFGSGVFGLTNNAFQPFGFSYGEGDPGGPPTFSDDSQTANEFFRFDTGITLFDTAVMNMVLGFRAAIESQSQGDNSVAEDLRLAAALDAVYIMALSEGVVLAEGVTPSPRALERVVEAMLLNGLVDSEAEAINAIIEALAATAAAEAMARAEVAEALGVSGVVAMSFKAAQSLVEGLLMGESAANTGTMMAAITDGLALSEGVGTELEAFEAITEGAAFVLRLRLDTGEYVAWALGTQNKQLSKYTNYPFNSFCKLGDLYLGCTDEGIFRLDGEDDAGDNIAARLRGAMTDMGTLAMKRNTTAYLAYSAPTGLILRTITTTKDGDKVAHTYRLKAQPASAIREGRIKLGGGVASMMWGWEIENVDGGPLELHALQFKPIVLERKMRGKNGGT